MKAALFLALLLFSGCATIDGVKVSEADRAACKESQDCTVWSRDELRALVLEAYRAGQRKDKGL